MITPRKSVRSILYGTLSDIDLLAIKMGNFSDADQREMERLVSGKLTLFKTYGGGRYTVDMKAPGFRSSRPSTSGGRQSFTFLHSTMAKRNIPAVADNRVYLEAPAGLGKGLREAGAHWDNRVTLAGRRGAWWVPQGGDIPAAATIAPAAAVAARVIGNHSSSALRRQVYIERVGALAEDEAGEISEGNISFGKSGRADFWRAVIARERANGRIQSQLIAELPHEVPAAGHRRILVRLGAAIAEMGEAWGLRWHGVVHQPDVHGDRRNYHLHLLYHDRPAIFDVESGWSFAATKAAATRDRGFVKDLRERYAEIVNGELELAAAGKRFDPRTYRQMGIGKVPGRHLGPAVSSLERRGFVTGAAGGNYAAEWGWRFASYAAGVGGEISRDAAIAGKITGSGLRPSSRRAHGELTAAILQYVTAGERLRAAAASAVVRQWGYSDMAVRPGLAAAANPSPAVRREASDLAKRIGEALARALRSPALAKARRRRALAVKRLTECRRLVRAEVLFDERARALAVLAAAESVLGGRVSEKEWRRRGREMESSVRVLEAGVEAIRERAGDLFERSPVAAAWRRRFAGISPFARLSRSRVLALAERGGVRGDEALAKEMRDLSVAEDALAAAAGDVRRRQRTDVSPVRRAAAVASAAAMASSVAAISAAAARLEEIDGRIRMAPTALALAIRRGLEKKLTVSRRADTGREV